MPKKKYVRPGWNSYVTELKQDSRRAFLCLHSVNSPRSGPSAELLRKNRTLFKLALRRCEHNEQTMRAEGVTSKLRPGNVVFFWSEAKNSDGSARTLSQSIDHVTGYTSLSERWKEK